MLTSVMRSPIVEGEHLDLEVCEEALPVFQALTIEEELLATSQRCLGLLAMAEDSGTTAASKLSHQGSQLRGVGNQLDGVNADLQSTARDIRGMRSWVGRFKNFARKKSRKRSTPAEITTEVPSTPVEGHLELRVRNTATPPPRPSDADERVKVILDRHLDDMLSSIAFLRQLALDLGSELDAQTVTIHRVARGTEDANESIVQQSHQLRKML